jgi:hypothetical protein
MDINSKFFEAIYYNDDFTEDICETPLEKFVYNKLYGKCFDVKFDVEKEFYNKVNYYCKDYGISNTMYGEVLRGLNKLIYRYLNDGDDIACGEYSGIWYYLKSYYEIPFIYGDHCVDYNIHFESFQPIGYIMGSNMVHNIMVNALVLETFDYLHRNNNEDISKYYHNIVNYFVNEDIIETFKKYNLDITYNMGLYSYPDYHDSFSINSIYEDIYIYFELSNIKICYSSMRCSFELSFNTKDLNEQLNKHSKLFEILFEYAQKDYKRSVEDELKEKAINLGYKIENNKIVF